MNEIDFMTLSQNECLEVSKSVLQRSKSKFEDAIILGERGKYDSATTLLIVSNEESLKALILFLEGLGFHIRKVKGMKGLFNNHKLRYLCAFIISVFSILTKELEKGLKAFMVGDEAFLNKIDPANPNFATMIKGYFLDRLLDIKREINFFSNIDKARQQGLYSDYRNGLIMVTENEFNELHVKISALNELIASFIESLNKNEAGIKEHFVILKRNFKKESVKKLELLIHKINSPGFNSYNNMLELANDLHYDLVNNHTEIDTMLGDEKRLLELSSSLKELKKLKKK